MRIRIIIILLAVSLLHGCGLTPKQQVQSIQAPTKKEEAELEKYLQPGTSTIQGQAFMRTRGGSVIYGAGSPVYLLPLTGYASLRHGEGFNIDQDPFLTKYTRKQVADANGNFEFSGIPEGDYLAASKVTWESRAYEYQGGGVSAKVKVGPGQSVKVILTD